MRPKRYGVGDVIFFRNGAHAKWHVEGYVKKVAFLHRPNPFVRWTRSVEAKSCRGARQLGSFRHPRLALRP
jgi:hypothetical protein